MNYHRTQRRLKRIAAKQAANFVPPPPPKPRNRHERMLARRRATLASQ